MELLTLFDFGQVGCGQCYSCDGLRGIGEAQEESL